MGKGWWVADVLRDISRAVVKSRCLKGKPKETHARLEVVVSQLGETWKGEKGSNSKVSQHLFGLCQAHMSHCFDSGSKDVRGVDVSTREPPNIRCHFRPVCLSVDSTSLSLAPII